MNTAPPRLRWWQYIGPWELRPFSVSMLTFLFAGYASVMTNMALTGRYLASIQSLVVINTISGVTTCLVLWLGLKLQRRHPIGLIGYLAILLLAAVATVEVRFLIDSPVRELTLREPIDVVWNSARAFLFMVVISTVLGMATRRLQHQVDLAAAALAVTREQQEWMIAADERVRRQVAEGLHDRVQAGIIAACLQLQALPTSDPAALNAVIERLEELRRLEVRGLARSLSPAVAEVGLLNPLEELAAQYEPAMVTTISIDPTLDSTSDEGYVQVQLGCYRIVEQALLNSAVHGRATQCTVDAWLDAGGRAQVRVRDNGRGLGADGAQRSGLGSALITTWVRALDGGWSWRPNHGGGAELVAELRVPHHELA